MLFQLVHYCSSVYPSLNTVYCGTKAQEDFKKFLIHIFTHSFHSFDKNKFLLGTNRFAIISLFVGFEYCCKPVQ